MSELVFYKEAVICIFVIGILFGLYLASFAHCLRWLIFQDGGWKIRKKINWVMLGITTYLSLYSTANFWDVIFLNFPFSSSRRRIEFLWLHFFLWFDLAASVRHIRNQLNYSIDWTVFFSIGRHVPVRSINHRRRPRMWHVLWWRVLLCWGYSILLDISLLGGFRQIMACYISTSGSVDILPSQRHHSELLWRRRSDHRYPRSNSTMPVKRTVEDVLFNQHRNKHIYDMYGFYLLSPYFWQAETPEYIAAIVFRIWRVWRMARSNKTGTSQNLYRLCRILTESGILYTLSSLFYLISFFLPINTVTTTVMNGVAGPLVSFLPISLVYILNVERH